MTNHCTYEQSQALKEIGFDMPVRDYYYTGNTAVNVDVLIPNHASLNHNADTLCASAPTHAEALQWFREKKGLHGWVEPFVKHLFNRWTYCITIKNVGLTALGSAIYPTHPEAESALVWKIIELIKEKKA